MNVSLQVCNHPDLFERRDVVSPLSLAVPSPVIPRLLYHQVYRVNTQWQRYSAVLPVSIGWYTLPCCYHYLEHTAACAY